jgi:proteasome lid subunit RPN8/RPN11
MTVHRDRALPVAMAQGKLVVAECVLDATSAALRSSAGEDGRPHEGLVLWLGQVIGDDTYVLSCHVPRSDHGWGHVLIDEKAVGRAGRLARALRLGVVAQVHSHPGKDTRHSDGDDDLIVMPREGMFSLVVGQYGRGAIEPEKGAGLHQRQAGQWVLVQPAEGVLLRAPTRAT